MCKCDDDCVCDCCGKCDCDTTRTVVLPPMPQLKDFPGSEYGYNTRAFSEALASWERVCLALATRQT